MRKMGVHGLERARGHAMNALPAILLNRDFPRWTQSHALTLLTGKWYAWAHVVELWLWAAGEHPSGKVGHLSPAILARAAQWKGDAADFVRVLRESGFLTPDGYLARWSEEQPTIVERAANNDTDEAHDAPAALMPVVVDNSRDWKQIPDAGLKERGRHWLRRNPGKTVADFMAHVASCTDARTDGARTHARRARSVRTERAESVHGNARNGARTETFKEGNPNETQSNSTSLSDDSAEKQGQDASANTEAGESERARTTDGERTDSARGPVAVQHGVHADSDRRAPSVHGALVPLPSSALRSVPCAETNEVFAHYVKATGKTDVSGHIRRHELIADRLREGFSVQRLKDHVDGLLSDAEFWNKPGKGKALLAFETVFKDAKTVEIGLGYFDAMQEQKRRASSPRPDRRQNAVNLPALPTDEQLAASRASRPRPTFNDREIA